MSGKALAAGDLAAPAASALPLTTYFSCRDDALARASRRDDIANLRDVSCELRSQLVHVRERDGVAEMLQKFNIQRLAVQVAREVEQMHFEFSSRFAERRVRTEIDRGGERVAAGKCSAGVDTIRW